MAIISKLGNTQIHEDVEQLKQGMGAVAPADHEHDDDYAPTDHEHDADYAPTDHNHDSDYAEIAHNHDLKYAGVTHDHNADYAQVDHDHDLEYPAIDHAHDLDYAAIDHDHTLDYADINHTHDTYNESEIDYQMDQKVDKSVRVGRLVNPLIHIFAQNALVKTIHGALKWQRDGKASYIDKTSGKMKWARPHEPREEKKGFMIEGESTNLCMYSQGNWDHSAWNGSSSVETIKTTGQPHIDGSNDAVLVAANSNMISHNFNYTNYIAQPNASVTFSVIVEAAGYRYLNMSHGNFSSWNTRGDATFDIVDGTVIRATTGAGAGTVTAHIEPLGNGRFLCQLRGGVRNSLELNSHIYLQTRELDNTSIFSGDGVSGFILHTVQVEELEVGTSYIKTNGSEVTRAADKVSFMAEGNHPLMANDVSYTLAFNWHLYGVIPGGQRLFMHDVPPRYGFPQWNSDKAAPHFHRSVPAYAADADISKPNDFAFVINADDDTVTGYTNGVAGAPVPQIDISNEGMPTEIKFFSDNFISQWAYGHIRDFRIYDFKLTDGEVEFLAGDNL